MSYRIANGAGFLGDQIGAAQQLVESTELDVLTLEYLAELTLSILAAQRAKNPQLGYARDFLDVLQTLLPAMTRQPQLHIVTNAGGVNPRACVIEAARRLAGAGLGDQRIGLVTGDDLLPHIERLAAEHELKNLDTGEPLSALGRPIVSANAYLGAAAMIAALDEDARIVITGRVADASLTLAPVMRRFDWPPDDYDRLASGTLAGHLIECGAQVTGGYSLRWSDRDLADVGYPIVELEEDGQFLVTKVAGTGGEVSRTTVVEQMIYEIGDPANYVTPDVVVDFTSACVEQLGSDRVRVSQVRGKPAPDSYKVSLAYHDGYMASAQLLVAGRDCVEKARRCAEIVFARVARAGLALERTNVECLGAGEAMPGSPVPSDLRETVLRMTVQDARREAVERFTREVAPLVTSGPAGVAGYAVARSPVRPVYAYWPTQIPKSAVEPRHEVRTADAWAREELP